MRELCSQTNGPFTRVARKSKSLSESLFPSQASPRFGALSQDSFGLFARRNVQKSFTALAALQRFRGSGLQVGRLPARNCPRLFGLYYPASPAPG
jgi:hypothetical protein